MLSTKTYARVTGVIFGVIALLHLWRLVAGWNAQIGGWAVPMWLSVAALVVAGWLAVEGFRQR